MHVKLSEEKQAALKNNLYLLFSHRNMRSVEKHGHSFLELTYIARGRARYELDSDRCEVCAGDYFIVDYGSTHAYLPEEMYGFDNIDLLFYPEFLEPSFKGTESLKLLLEKRFPSFRMGYLHKNPARMIFHDHSGRIRELLGLISEENESRRAGYGALVSCYLAEILLLTLREIDGAHGAFAGQENANRFLSYIDNHYAEDLTLARLAEEMNYSVPYMSRMFHEKMGVSFIRYLQSYRVAQGCRLLSAEGVSLAEAAEAVGYRDPKFFASLIKRETGLTPSSFRKKR